MVEQLTFNQLVEGSSPPGVTFFCWQQPAPKAGFGVNLEQESPTAVSLAAVYGIFQESDHFNVSLLI